MSEMIERVARAITKADGDDPDGSTGSLLNESEVWWQHRIPLARAAIEAMRQPTDAMLACGEQWGLPSDPMGLKRWQEMIDAALEGK